MQANSGAKIKEGHACPYCCRRFKSIQAVGGHSRSCFGKDAAKRRREEEEDETRPVRARAMPFALSAASRALRFEDNILKALPESEERIEEVFADGQCSSDREHEISDFITLLPQDVTEPALVVGEPTYFQSEDVDTATEYEVLEASVNVLTKLSNKAGAKAVDALINVLQHKSFSATLFAKSVSSIKQLQEESDDFLLKWLADMQFNEEVIRDPEDGRITGKGYFRDPVETLKRQFAKVPVDAIQYEPFVETNRMNERVYNHALGSLLAEEAIPLIKAQIMKGLKGEVWINRFSFICAVQVYSDKSCQTLKSSSHAFLPVHVVPLNFSQQSRQKIVSSNDSVVAYLPVDCMRAAASEEVENLWDEDALAAEGAAATGKTERPSKQRLLQQALERALKPLWDTTRNGMLVTDGSNQTRRGHPVLFSYVADLPEACDVGCTVRGHCPRCLASGKDMASPHTFEARSFTKTEEKLASLVSATDPSISKLIQNRMWANGTTTVRPSLFSWPFMNLHRGLDLHSTFRYETLHNLHQGISKLLKTCLSDRLRSKNLTTSEYIDSRRKRKPLASMRTRFLEKANRVLTLINEQSPCTSINFDKSRKSNTEQLNGLFTGTGLASMMEAKDLSEVDQVFPIVAATIDRLCGYQSSALNTKVSVMYCDLVNIATRRFADPGLTEQDLCALEAHIEAFKKLSIEAYEKFQRSGMGTPKFHLLDHLVSDIRMCGSLANYSADTFEASHKFYKQAYQATSKRKSTGQEEALKRAVRAQAKVAAPSATIRDQSTSGLPMRAKIVDKLSGTAPISRALTTKKQDAISQDSIGISAGGEKGTWFDIVAHSKVCSRTHKNGSSTTGRGDQQFVRSLCEDVGGPERLRFLVAQIQTVYNPDAFARVRRPRSAVVASIPIPSLECCETTAVQNDEIADRKIYCLDDGERELQRIVSSHRYYGSQQARQDCVMIEVSQTGEPGLSKTRQRVREVYVAKALAFLAFPPSKTAAVVKSSEEEVQLALIRYYDRCNAEDLDLIDRTLGCVKMNWSTRALECDGVQSAGTSEGHDPNPTEKQDFDLAYLDVQPVSTIRGRLHVVRGDFELSDALSYTSMHLDRWESHWFYINRFKHPSRSGRYSIHDRTDRLT